MFLPRDGIVPIGGGSILRRTVGGLLARRRPHPWWLNANPNTKKFTIDGANAGNAGKSSWTAPRE